MKYIIIIIIIVAIGAGGYFGYIYLTKKSLIDQIVAKYSKDPSFQFDPKVAMKYDIKTLNGVLDGSIH